jgi:hypothetical protein
MRSFYNFNVLKTFTFKTQNYCHIYENIFCWHVLMLTIKVSALRDHMFSNCHDCLKVGFTFLTDVGKVQIEWLYSDVYHCEHCISRVLLDQNACI